MGESLDKVKERTKKLKDREILELLLAEIYNIKKGLASESKIRDLFQEEILEKIQNITTNEDSDDYDDSEDEDEDEDKEDIEEMKEKLKKDTKKQIKKEREKYEQERKRKEFRNKHGGDIVVNRQK